MFNIIQNLDFNIITFVEKNIHNNLLDKVMPLVSSLGNGGFIWIIICIFLLIHKKYRKAGIMLASTLLLISLLGEGIIKNIVQRNRPFLNIPTLNLIIKAPKSYSFPSGHTASSFAAATILTYNFKKYGFLLFLTAALIAFSRVYLFVHYPSDVVGGIILGILGTGVVVKVFNAYELKKKTEI